MGQARKRKKARASLRKGQRKEETRRSERRKDTLKSHGGWGAEEARRMSVGNESLDKGYAWNKRRKETSEGRKGEGGRDESRLGRRGRDRSARALATGARELVGRKEGGEEGHSTLIQCRFGAEASRKCTCSRALENAAGPSVDRTHPSRRAAFASRQHLPVERPLRSATSPRLRDGSGRAFYAHLNVHSARTCAFYARTRML